MAETAPLDDPTYVPEHPPVNGRIPEVVALWGPASQLRWFRRFRDQVGSQTIAVWEQHYCASVEHKGSCCQSCSQYGGMGVDIDDHCCCTGLREARGRA